MSKGDCPALNWCFTINNYHESDELRLKAVFDSGVAEYIIFGREVGASGTPHLQGYIRMKKKLRLNGMKKLHCTAHWEIARGNLRANIEYCSKEGNHVEYGETPVSDLSNKKLNRERTVKVFEKVMDETKSLVEVKKALPVAFYYNHRSLVSGWLLLQKPIERPGITVLWFHGPPGIGKSMMAHKLLPLAYIKDPKTKWWNGYMMENSVIIDDFARDCADMNHLLRWFDCYKAQVETKGGQVALHATQFIVTSNFSPEELYKVSDHIVNGQPPIAGEGRSYRRDSTTSHTQLPALLRRICVVKFERALGRSHVSFKKGSEWVNSFDLAVLGSLFSCEEKTSTETSAGRVSRERSPYGIRVPSGSESVESKEEERSDGRSNV